MAEGSRRFDGYVRVSRRLGREGASYISPTVQRDAIERWAAYANVKIVAWHVDEDQSGGTQDRPGLREAIRRVEAHETQGIACWKLSRFGRNVAGALADIQRIRAASGDVVFTEEQIDTSGPFGQFILTVMFAVVTLERDNLSQGFEIAKARAFDRGAHISRTPYGYRRTDESTLELEADEAGHVSEAYRLAASRGLRAAVEYLEGNAGGRRWTASTVRRTLASRVYLGEQRNGPRVNREAHAPLVSLAVWTAAQSGPLPRAPSAQFILSGLARCGTCGGPMVGSRGGKGQRTYRCMNRCDRGAVITASILEDHVSEWARAYLAVLQTSVSDPQADALIILERAVTDAEGELDAFAGDLAMRRALGDRYHQHLQARADAVEQARAAYREQARAAQTELLLSSDDLLDPDRPELMAAALRGMLDSIVVVPGRGLTVDQRARLVLPTESDGAPGELGPEGS